MTLDADITEVLVLMQRATSEPWLLGVDRSKNPVVTDYHGRVVIDGDAYAEDIKLIVQMRSLLPRLIKDRELTNERHLAAMRKLEHEANEQTKRIAEIRRLAEEQIEGLGKALAEVRAQLEAAQDDLPRLRRAAEEHEQMVPLVSTAKNWHRTRYSPGLVAAVERYIAWEQTRSTKEPK